MCIKNKNKQMQEFGDQCHEPANNVLDSLIELKRTLQDDLLLGSEALSHEDQASLLVLIGGVINLAQKIAGYLGVNIKTSCNNAIRKIANEAKKKAIDER